MGDPMFIQDYMQQTHDSSRTTAADNSWFVPWLPAAGIMYTTEKRFPYCSV